MTDLEEKPDPSDPNVKASEAAENETELDEDQDQEPAPQPWTPERVVEWNAYYDVYVILGVLLLAFIASSNRITQPSVWNKLQVGRIISETGRPVTTDLFSYTETDKPWVNIPWLFDWSHAVIYKLAAGFSPIDPTDPVASTARSDQIAAGVLVGLAALARLLTAFFLLRIRRSGPGAWWTAICVVLAIGAIVTPNGASFTRDAIAVTIGGIANPGPVAPESWGLLLLSIELYFLHNALNRGRKLSAYLLLPLFLLWANVDESFVVGLLVLAASAFGLLLPTRPSKVVSKSADLEIDTEPSGSISFPMAFGLLIGSALIVTVNPSNFRIYGAALSPFIELFGPASDTATNDQMSYFGPMIREKLPTVWKSLVLYYLTIVGIGFGSFALNSKRFNPSRFLVYTLLAILWGVFIRYSADFAVIFATTLALNGQEWYQGVFGKTGKISVRWSLWSVGGRGITIILVFAMIGKAITGYGSTYGEPTFGFGYAPDEFAFEAADFLKTAPIKGNVLNTLKALGDAIVFRAYPDRKTFIDSRRDLFPQELLNKLQTVRKAIADDDIAAWKPILDEYQISVVMIQVPSSPLTYSLLMQSPNWIPFYDDGNVVMFGRADAVEGDLAFFKANRLEADQLAYKRTKPTPAVERPPTPVTWMDTVFESRANARPQAHTESSRRWLIGATTNPDDVKPADPAHCLLAIQEARAALASRPDDSQAFRLLSEAYRGLMNQESALLGGLKLTPDTLKIIGRINPRVDILMMRYRQRATALNYAIQTTPPPKTDFARRELQALNLELYQLYLQVNFVDMARDRLQSILDKSDSKDFNLESRAQLSQELARLNDRVKTVQNQMQEFSLEQQQGPLQLAGYALNQGMPGLAIHELEEAERTGQNPALVKPQLLDLYCDTGQPEKSLEMLATGTIEDTNFGSEPGMSSMRQGRAFFLLGNSEYAGTLWEKYAIPRLREFRAMRALGASQGIIKGEAQAAAAALLELPDQIAQQALWEFDAGLCRLEGGVPELAAEHFKKALELAPAIATKPVIEYYLEKLGVPAKASTTEPTKAADAKPAVSTTTPTPEPAKNP